MWGDSACMPYMGGKVYVSSFQRILRFVNWTPVEGDMVDLVKGAQIGRFCGLRQRWTLSGPKNSGTRIIKFGGPKWFRRRRYFKQRVGMLL